MPARMDTMGDRWPTLMVMACSAGLAVRQTGRGQNRSAPSWRIGVTGEMAVVENGRHPAKRRAAEREPGPITTISVMIARSACMDPGSLSLRSLARDDRLGYPSIFEKSA